MKNAIKLQAIQRIAGIAAIAADIRLFFVACGAIIPNNIAKLMLILSQGGNE
ncbi:MAG: hypothetical protein LBH43_17075 [Treponema sp.]|nr:hypothetical protein [Treponema sp.]